MCRGSGAPCSPHTAARCQGEEWGSPLQLPEGWGERQEQEHGDLKEARGPNPAQLLGCNASCSPTRDPIHPAHAVGFMAEEISWRNFHLWFAKGFSPKNHDLIAVIIFIKLSRVFFQWLFKAYLKDIDSRGMPG